MTRYKKFIEGSSDFNSQFLSQMQRVNRNTGNFSRKIVGLAVQIIERHVVQYDQEHHVNKREFMYKWLGRS